jgi:hypothetical protein
MKKTTTTYAIGIVLLAATMARAQEKAPPDGATQPRRGQTPLQVRMVLARKQGEKMLSRLPYTLVCVANAERRTSLRMGVEVPVALGDGKGMQYRNVGTNIDCQASALDDGSYKVNLNVEQSSIGDAPSGSSGGNPMFQTFNSAFAAVLRDGQGAVYTAATDPVSGEEATIEVSLKVMK